MQKQKTKAEKHSCFMPKEHLYTGLIITAKWCTFASSIFQLSNFATKFFFSLFLLRFQCDTEDFRTKVHCQWLRLSIVCMVYTSPKVFFLSLVCGMKRKPGNKQNITFRSLCRSEWHEKGKSVFHAVYFLLFILTI